MSCKSILSLLCVLLLAGCHGKINDSQHNETEIDSSLPTGASTEENQTIDIYFLGHKIHCNGKDLVTEFNRICKEDNSLSFDSVSRNVDLYGTTFHLNFDKRTPNSFMLVSSVQPDTKQIEKVREAISKFHGDEYLEEDCHYSWLPFSDSTKIRQDYPVIHLRRVRSEEGGTAIIVRNCSAIL